MRAFWTSELASSWVLEDDDGTLWTVPAGGGPKAQFIGDPSLLEPIDVSSSKPASLRVRLVGITEIARRCSVQRETVQKWRQRHEDFPTPVADLAAGPVWTWDAVDRWLRVHPTRGEVASPLARAAVRGGRQPRLEGPAPRWKPGSASLFSGEADDYRLIAMPQSGEAGWPLYLQGYRMAAGLIRDEILKTKADQDFYLYPLVFLYRQLIELHLKLVVDLGRQLQGGRGRPMKTHSLVALWGVASQHIRRTWPNDDTDTRALQADLAEFDALDAGSYAFRYPVGTGQDPALPPELTRFNVRTFAERAGEIGDYLESVSEGLWVYRDSAREMAAEYSP